jgi:hypothetical protein
MQEAARALILGDYLTVDAARYPRALESLEWSLKAARILDVLEQIYRFLSSPPRIHNSTKYSGRENWIKIANGIGLYLTVGKK